MYTRHADRYIWQTAAMSPRRVVVRGVPYIITTDARDRVRVLRKRSLYIVGGVIKAIVAAGKEGAWLKRADVIYDARVRGGIVLTPGFINTHAHPPMYLLRSTTWLEREIATTEESLVLARRIERQMDVADQTIAALGDFTEQQKFGTTTVVSHYHTPQATRVAAIRARIRLVDAVSVASETDPRASLQRVRPWLKAVPPLITPGITIHTLQRVTPSELKRVRQLLQRHPKVLLTIHCAETDTEVAAVEAKHGLRPVALLAQAKLLNRRLLLSHAVHFTADEIRLLAKHKVGIAHLPTSNRFHKSGDFPFAAYVLAGAFPQVTLGTDSVISKSRLDLISEGFQAKLMHQSSTVPATFSDIFKMLTCNGARVIGQERSLGRIAVGYKADLVFWKLKDRMFVPFDERHPETLLGNFIGHGGYVARDVMVNGQFVISGRRHNFVNESTLLTDLQKHHTALRKRIKKVIGNAVQ